MQLLKKVWSRKVKSEARIDIVLGLGILGIILSIIFIV